jgi:hypothetical protein
VIALNLVRVRTDGETVGTEWIRNEGGNLLYNVEVGIQATTEDLQQWASDDQRVSDDLALQVRIAGATHAEARQCISRALSCFVAAALFIVVALM